MTTVETKIEFGNLLRDRLKLKGLTISAFAESMGFDMQFYVSGKVFPRNLIKLERICKPLDIPIDSLDLYSLVNRRHYPAFNLGFRHGTQNDGRVIDGLPLENPARVLSSNSVDITLPGFSIGSTGKYGLIVGDCIAMRNLFSLLDNIVSNPNQDSIVLIRGETGTGKELIAKAIHCNGLRNPYPFVPVNITSMPGGILESELFGHKRGAFTDASSDKTGFFQETGKGTLFLDEIGSLDPSTQSKLLRVLQENYYYPVGSTKAISFNGRFIAATQDDLEEAVKMRKFRADLFYRLNTINVNLPPLRDRKQDIPLLFSYFVSVYNKKYGTNYLGRINDDSLRMLESYGFPGNVRELNSLIIKAIFKNPEEKEIKIESLI